MMCKLSEDIRYAITRNPSLWLVELDVDDWLSERRTNIIVWLWLDIPSVVYEDQHRQEQGCCACTGLLRREPSLLSL